MNTLTQNEATVNILADGVYPYDDPTPVDYRGQVDKWVIRIDGEEVAWHSGTKQEAEAAYHDMLRVECDHQRNPANGLGRWWEIRTADYTVSISRDGEVSYEDC